MNTYYIRHGFDTTILDLLLVILHTWFLVNLHVILQPINAKYISFGTKVAALGIILLYVGKGQSRNRKK